MSNNKYSVCYVVMLAIIINLQSLVYALDSDACNFFKMFIRPESLVFDVGAHVGSKTDLFINCGARVICVEPQPLCVAALRERFHDNANVVIVNKGLAAKLCKMMMMICSKATTISTFSTDWTQFGRFAHNFVWDKNIEVEMTTLDELIKIYGSPQFIKIDVENFEYEVLSGLTQVVPCLSFEFAIEYIGNAEKCLNRLAYLGFTQFNFAVGEVPHLALPEWGSAEDVLGQIKSGIFHAEGGLLWGDIYARCL